MFYLIRCIIGTTIWYLLSDKKRWREILPVSFFASYLGVISDHLMIYYKLWEYHGAHPLVASVANNLVCYIIIPYLFIQYLPENKTFKNMFLHFLLWTTIAISIELIHLKLGYIEHYMWWTTLHSYIADWLLYYIFYKYYHIFQFHKLSTKINN